MSMRTTSFQICAIAAVLGLGFTPLTGTAQGSAVAVRPVKPGIEQGVRWSELKPAQQLSLKPLQAEWSTLDPRSKRKWLDLSSKFSTMAPEEQSRVQQRMTDWGRLTPRERGEARLHFQQAKQLPAQDREARWKAYESLSPEQKQRLAARLPLTTGSVSSNPGSALDDVRKIGPSVARADRSTRGAPPQPKSNMVPNPSFAAPPKPVAPTIMQASPGATTTAINKRAAPPGHQQTGMPKITATPEFVNKATLLPQRGPQGAAAQAASTSGTATSQ